MTHSAPAQLLVRYYEIALKGKHRPRFTRLLRHNLRDALGPLRSGPMRSLPGCIAVPLRDPELWPEVETRVSRLFGVANYSIGFAVPPSLDALCRAVEQNRPLLGPGGSFRVRCRRADKSFPLRSVDIERELGGFVHERFCLPVDLERPDLELWVEVLPGRIFVSFGKRPGPGGLPTGASGEAVALLSGGIDSPVAAARIARRGALVRLVHFSGQPFEDRSSERKARDHARTLALWQLRSELHHVPFGEVQRRVAVFAPAALRIVLYRRLMLRVAERIAERTGALALVTGESLGQVSSQTLQNLAVIDQAARLPVLRPLVGMDKDEIVAQARALGTYETSIRPGSDCCQVFLPRNASTGAELGRVLQAESRLEVPALVELALGGESRESFSAHFCQEVATTQRPASSTNPRSSS
jgi:tRNA uracil 4-sulfurtransferase